MTFNTRGKGYGAAMPEPVRALARSGQHPARAVDCPHCGATNRKPCTTRSGTRRITSIPVHPQRASAWVRSIAVCPTCQVEPGTPCHQDGRALAGGAVHDARDEEAQVTT